jgi:hypothetical protein
MACRSCGRRSLRYSISNFLKNKKTLKLEEDTVVKMERINGKLVPKVLRKSELSPEELEELLKQ